jgi:sterol desaturase/sphingolipid hydroxylase (fatty acid hydroxylase superfamily)
MLRIALVTAGFALGLLLLERAVPLRARRAGFWARLAVNLVMAALAYAVAGALVTPAANRLMSLAGGGAFGLLRWLELPPVAAGASAVLLMDLSFYYWHRLNHRLPLLWRFHNVHHIDPDLDVTTAVRFHFGEIALSTVFRSVQVAVLGIGLPAYASYEAILQCANLFQHSNVRLPIRVERALNLLLVTPRMHGIHHSEIEGEANSNYSVVFSFWDRLHRSICLGVPQAQVRVGVPAYARREDNALLAALTHPFRRQRDYWTAPDGKRPRRETPTGPRHILSE